MFDAFGFSVGSLDF